MGHFLVLSQVPSELDSAPAIRKAVIPFKSICLQTIPASPTAVNDVPSFSVMFTIVIRAAVLIIFPSLPVDRYGRIGLSSNEPGQTQISALHLETIYRRLVHATGAPTFPPG